MLDEFCNSLSDEAQLKIALRLGKLALPVWSKHFSDRPYDIDKVNELFNASNHIEGSAKKIDADFPDRALKKINRSYENAKKKNGSPVPLMKSDSTLSPLLATSMQPLTNPKWDDILPYTVRLVFTLVWNILTWIQFQRSTGANETHIYIAINQAADVLMSEKILSVPQIEEILSEYKKETRSENEDSEWEKAAGVKESGVLTTNEIYKKIAGEKIIKDATGIEPAQEILRQMKEEGKSYWDRWEEYYSSICKTYSYNEEKKSFWLSEADVLVGSFFYEYPMSEKEMLEFISGVSLSDLRGSGFEI